MFLIPFFSIAHPYPLKGNHPAKKARAVLPLGSLPAMLWLVRWQAGQRVEGASKTFLKWFLFLSIFLYSISSQAQNFHAGAFAGVSTSQVSGDNLAGFNKVGLYAGGFVNTQLSEKWNMQMELSYVGKGSRPSQDDRNANFPGLFPTLNYAEVPVLFIYKAKPKINIEAGLAFGVLVYSREEDIFTERPIERPYNKTDYSFIIGLDYFLSEKWSINSRLSNSFIPIRAHESGQTYGLNRGQYNTVLAFSLRYHF